MALIVGYEKVCENVARTNDELVEIISSGDSVALFLASWCTPCKWLVGDFSSFNMVDFLKGERINSAYVDVDSFDSAKLYDVRAIPDILMFRDGELVYRSVGARGNSSFRQEIGLWLPK